MALTYSATLKDKRLQLVADLVDGLTPADATGTESAGRLVIGTSALAGGSTGKLLEYVLETPAFEVVGGVMTLQGAPISATATADGKAAKAELRNNAGAVVVSGLTVGTIDSHVIVATTNIHVGDTIAVTSATITHG